MEHGLGLGGVVRIILDDVGEIADCLFHLPEFELGQAAVAEGAVPVRLQLEPGWMKLGRPWLDAVVVWRGQKAGRAGVGVRFARMDREQTEVLSGYLKNAG